MKVLFVTTKSPLPMNDGHSLRSFNLLKAVAQNHEVTLLSYVKYPVEYEYVRASVHLSDSFLFQIIVPV